MDQLEAGRGAYAIRALLDLCFGIWPKKGGRPPFLGHAMKPRLDRAPPARDPSRLSAHRATAAGARGKAWAPAPMIGGLERIIAIRMDWTSQIW